MSPVSCPECHGTTAIRSRRRSVLDYLLAIIGLYPYRCGTCMRRFRRFGGGWRRRAEDSEPGE